MPRLREDLSGEYPVLHCRWNPVAEEKIVIKSAFGRLRRLWLRQEQRGAPRHRVDWPIRYKRIEPAAGKQATFRDLSAAGAGVVVREAFKPGSAIHLEFMLPGQPSTLTVRGRVVWAKEMYPLIRPLEQGRLYYVGIQFNDMDKLTKQRLADALKRGRR